MVTMESTILVPWPLVGITLQIIQPFEFWVVFDLHENLLE